MTIYRDGNAIVLTQRELHDAYFEYMEKDDIETVEANFAWEDIVGLGIDGVEAISPKLWETEGIVDVASMYRQNLNEEVYDCLVRSVETWVLDNIDDE